MEKKEIRILHIDTDRNWRGGQQQAFYLHSHLHKMGFFSLMLTQPGSAMNKKCSAENLPVVAKKIWGELDLFAVGKIVKICQREKITIIHCHNAHAVTLGIIAKIFLKDIKVIAVRRVDFHVRSKWKYNTSLVNSVVCISNSIKNVLISDNIKAEKLVVIHSGIDISKFNSIDENSGIKNEFKIDEDKIVIGTIAAFVGHKDYGNLLEAASIVLKLNENVVFLAVGDGELLDEMKIKAKQLNIENSFLFTGYRKDTANFLAAFDIFVLASKKEGLGTSILDAQAIGLPVVVTRAGGMPEIVEDGINGRIVDAQDPAQLAAALQELVEDEHKRKIFGKNSKKSVERFDIKKTVGGNILLYKNLLKN